MRDPKQIFQTKQAEQKLLERIAKQEAFKARLGKIVNEKTDYKLINVDFEKDTCNFVPKKLTDLSYASNSLGFSAHINKEGTGLDSIDFCLETIEGDFPASYTDNQHDLNCFLKAVNVVKQYLIKKA